MVEGDAEPAPVPAGARVLFITVSGAPCLLSGHPSSYPSPSPQLLAWGETIAVLLWYRKCPNWHEEKQAGHPSSQGPYTSLDQGT